MNVQDLMNEYYGTDEGFIVKDAPVISTTTGVYNAVFGKLVWSLLNQEANVFGVLPKTPWNKSGWRLMTARAGTTADGGIGEAAAVPATIKPTWVEVTNTIKEVAHAFDVSERQLLHTESDDAIGDLEMMRQVMGVKHKEAINQQLLADASAEAAAASGNYAGKDGFETIDRVISSDSEEDAFGGSYTTYFDIFGLDRDSATTYDSYVDHNSGTDRDVSDEQIRTAISGIREDGGNTTVIVSGHDTYREIVGLYADQVRYNVVNESKVTLGVNGIQTQEGMDVGMTITSIYGIPFIQSKDVIKDTISRVYLLDTSDPEGYGEPRIGVSIAKPTLYFESGVRTGNPFSTNKFATEGVYYTAGEIKAPSLMAQGKIRDLK